MLLNVVLCNICDELIDDVLKPACTMQVHAQKQEELQHIEDQLVPLKNARSSLLRASQQLQRLKQW